MGGRARIIWTAFQMVTTELLYAVLSFRSFLSSAISVAGTGLFAAFRRFGGRLLIEFRNVSHDCNVRAVRSAKWKYLIRSNKHVSIRTIYFCPPGNNWWTERSYAGRTHGWRRQHLLSDRRWLDAATKHSGYVSGQGAGKCVGVIAYDYINARWSCLFTSNTGLYTHQNTTWENDIQQIKDFMSGLATPPATDLIGNDVPYPRSFVGTVG